MERKPCIMEQPSEMYARQAKKGNKMSKATVKVAENEERITKSPAPKPFAELARHIASGLTQLAPTVDSSARADRCMLALQSMMEWLGPQWDVQPFGSFANGFGTVHSDLDVTCCHGGEGQRVAASDLTMLIQPMLREHGSFSVVEEILGARVPILKLRFEDVLDVDISCHNPMPVNNTRLLKAYSRLDGRIQDLGLSIKLWAKGSGLCDASNSNLSSYSFMLLVVYFLQVHPDTQLPLLPVDAFLDGGLKEGDERVIAAMAGWQCELSLAELVARFFAFYSSSDPNGFLWGSEVVSVRCGHRATSQHPIFARLRGRYAWRLHIEDPYQLERNLHAVLGEVEEEQLRTAFSDAWRDIQSNRVPVALQSADLHYQPFLNDIQVSPFWVNNDIPDGPVISSTQQQDSHASSLERWLDKSQPNKENLLADLIQMCKVVSSSTDSTKSGGTPRTTGSDDESGTESCGESHTSASQ